MQHNRILRLPHYEETNRRWGGFMSNWLSRATQCASYINTWWIFIVGILATVMSWLMSWIEPIWQLGWAAVIVSGLMAASLLIIAIFLIAALLSTMRVDRRRGGRAIAAPPSNNELQKPSPDNEASEQIAALEARNKDLQEQIEGLSKQSPPPRINAFAYLRRPNKDSLIIEWNAPVRDQNAAVALDYRPRGEKPRRIVLSSQVRLMERQTVKTVICQPNSRGSWAWNVEDGGEIVIHEGIVMCRLAIIGSDGREHYWRFCIADRAFQETPHVVGENVFEDNFER